MAIVIMIADTGLRPFLAVNGSLEIEINRIKAVKCYVKNYLLIDILASIPFDYILRIGVPFSMPVHCFRLLRLLKFYRLLELMRLIRQQTSVNAPVFRILLLFGSFIVISHWFNCILLFVATREMY